MNALVPRAMQNAKRKIGWIDVDVAVGYRTDMGFIDQRSGRSHRICPPYKNTEVLTQDDSHIVWSIRQRDGTPHGVLLRTTVLRKIFLKENVPYRIVGDGAVCYRSDVRFISKTYCPCHSEPAKNLVLTMINQTYVL